MNIHIAHTDYPVINRKELFIITRFFYGEKGWDDFIYESKVNPRFCRVKTLKEADFVLLPFPISWYFKEGKISLLREINDQCVKYGIKAYGYVSGDFGIAYPEFSNIVYFRMGGFGHQLSDKNKGFPVALSDHFQGIFKKENIIPVAKRELPVIGFCGHATNSYNKRLKELAKCIKENGRRFIQNPFRRDWEPLFASAYERALLLRSFKNSPLIVTNFIYRNHYRAGAKTVEERTQTTLEYYNNINESDYVLCVRGAGNFSVRFYEALMMGKIPVFVNTDCLLPFDKQIDWKQHVVWVEWEERKNIAEIVHAFHENLSDEAFINLQIANRNLWKETLSVNGMLSILSNDI